MSIVIMRSGCGYEAVQQNFSNEHFGGRRGNFTWIFDPVTAYGEPGAVCFRFLRSDSTHKLTVLDIAEALFGDRTTRMNLMVFVGFLIRPPTPFASRPNSLADEMLQSYSYPEDD